MSLRNARFNKGEYYHLYNRGNSKQEIFHDEEDYLRFISLLYISNTSENFNLYDLNRIFNFNVYELDIKNTIVSVGAYCLMPNHFHLLITEKVEGGISKFMQKLSTAYVMYYNKKYVHTGGLFEGKFKSIHVDNDTQMKYLFSYIHLNPIKLIQKDWKKEGIKNKKESLKFLSSYIYSSYQDFLKKNRIQKKILNVNDFPKYFPVKSLFIKEILEWLSSALGKT